MATSSIASMHKFAFTGLTGLPTTQKDRYLVFSSHRDKRHKISTAETLLHRVIKLPSASQGKNATTSLMLYESTTMPPMLFLPS